MKNIFNETIESLENYFISINEKKYRATQIYDYLYKKRIYDIKKMTNISNNLKEKILKDYNFDFIKIITKQEDTDVKKYLFKLADGNTIESVFIVSHHADELGIPVDSEIKVIKNADGISQIQ